MPWINGDVRLEDMSEVDPARLRSEPFVLFVASTSGQGELARNGMVWPHGGCEVIGRVAPNMSPALLWRQLWGCARCPYALFMCLHFESLLSLRAMSHYKGTLAPSLTVPWPLWLVRATAVGVLTQAHTASRT